MLTFQVLRTRKRLTLLAAVGIVCLTAIGVWAFFTAFGSGSGNATVGTLNPPTNVTATTTPGTSTVHVSWTASTLSNGSAPTGYHVTRIKNSDSSTANACGTSPSSTTTSTSCNDTSVPDGTYHYTVTAVYHSWTATSTSSNNVTVASLDHFAMTAPATATAGTAFSVTVTAKDAANNTIAGYTGTVHFTSSDGQAVLPANYTFTTGSGNDNGTHTFTNAVMLKTAGNQTVSVNDTVQTGATGSATVSVSAASAANLVFTQQPSNSTGGVAFPTQPKVTVEDTFGNTVTTDSSTVTLSITSGTPTSGGPGTLSGCTQSETAGVVTFSGCKIDTAGTGYKLHAIDGTLTAADSAAFNITVGPASQIALSGTTTNLASGSTRTFTATIQDAGGNTVTTGADSTVSVTFSQTGGTGSVTGTGAATASGGVATKTVTGNVAGTVNLQASATLSGPGATNSNTLSFTVTGPTVVSVSINNKTGGTAGQAEAGDTIVITYSQTLKMTSICSNSTLGNTSSGSITPNATSTTVTLTKSSGTDVTFGSTDCGGSLHIGAISLKKQYVTGSGSANKSFGGSTVSWNGSNTITITLGSTLGGTGTLAQVTTTDGTYTPDPTIKDPANNFISGTFTWSAVQSF